MLSLNITKRILTNGIFFFLIFVRKLTVNQFFCIGFEAMLFKTSWVCAKTQGV